MVAALAPHPTALSHPDPARHGQRLAPELTGATARVSRTVGARHAGTHPPLFLEAQVPEITVNRLLEGPWLLEPAAS